MRVTVRAVERTQTYANVRYVYMPEPENEHVVTLSGKDGVRVDIRIPKDQFGSVEVTEED